MSSPNSKSNGIGGATAGSLIAPQICNCPCHENGGESHPCGGMCWHPGVDQYGLPLNYSYASVTQLLRAALVYGVSDKAIESAIYESFVLSAHEAETGASTAVRDAYENLKNILIGLLVKGED